MEAWASLVVCAAAFVFAHDVCAWCRTSTVPTDVPGECSMTGVPLHWTQLCAGYSIHVSGSPDLTLDDIHTAAADAAARWQHASCDATGAAPYFQMMALPDTTTPTGYASRGPNANTVSFNSAWASANDSVHLPGTIAVTLVTYDIRTGEILDADVEMNEHSAGNPDGLVFTVGAANPMTADLPTILTHEFGHFQGLGHTSDMMAVMWPTAGLGEQRRNLTADDVAGICNAYPPDNTPTDRTCNPVPFGGFAPTPHGARVTGGCGIVVPPGRPAGAIVAVVVALSCARRRRRESR